MEKKLTMYDLENKFEKTIFSEELAERLMMGEVLFMERNIQEPGLYNIFIDSRRKRPIATVKLDLTSCYIDRFRNYRYKIVDLNRDIHYYITDDDTVYEFSSEGEPNCLYIEDFIYFINNEIDFQDVYAVDNDMNIFDLTALLESLRLFV